ncbi:Iojap-related protein, partial [Candidatus Omnitrophus magneticus]
KAHAIARVALEKEGEDILDLDLTKSANIFNYFVMITAGSSKRVQTIAKAIDEEQSVNWKQSDRLEGKNNPSWTLVDAGDVIAHVFYKDARNFYGIERLWLSAPREEINEKCLKKTLKKKLSKSSAKA